MGTQGTHAMPCDSMGPMRSHGTQGIPWDPIFVCGWVAAPDPPRRTRENDNENDNNENDENDENDNGNTVTLSLCAQG